ncbi:hypothetical protein C4J81_16435 [Deltaproteobacteria bacterium Smac51]|nr:hypothetical protein C4J81_16435 [Deltaproteobacteria bacterium Smac51]
MLVEVVWLVVVEAARRVQVAALPALPHPMEEWAGPALGMNMDMATAVVEEEVVPFPQVIQVSLVLLVTVLFMEVLEVLLAATAVKAALVPELWSITMDDTQKTTIYYSPNGNPEVWVEKPQGYFTEQEWLNRHPEPEPTVADTIALRMSELQTKLDALDAEFLTTRVLAGLALGDEYALGEYDKHEKLAKPLRDQWRSLKDELDSLPDK